jgi:TPR repeat protein
MFCARLIFSLLAFGLLAVTALAETPSQAQFERGMELGKAGDIDAALPLIRSAAEAGLAEAEYTLGTMYTHGQGVAESKTIAREWYHKAAAQDHPGAIYSIGLHYDQGLEIEQNLATALNYYERASALGHGEAAYNAGHILFMGDGVEEDMARGLTFFQVAAKAGLGGASLALGWAHEFGLGTDQNYRLANMNYTFAELNGKPFASLFKADHHVKMNEEAIALQQAGRFAQALALFDSACDDASGFGCYNAGVIRLEGRHGFARDIPRALSQLRDACIFETAYGCRGHAAAVLYAPGTLHKSDVEMAAKLITQECEGGDQGQCLNLAYMKYYTRFGMPDAEGAISLLAKACYNDGYKPACKPHQDLYNTQLALSPAPAAPRQRGAFEQALHNGLDALSGGLKVWGQAAAASSGSSYAYGNYGAASSSSTTYNQMDTYQAWQDKQDFNNYLSRMRSYGSAYAAGCRPGNPYC